MNGIISIGFLNNLSYQIESHNHPNWEIVYYTYGRGINTIAEKKYSFRPGVIICQPPEIEHSEHSENGFQNYHFSVRSFDLSNKALPLLIQDDVSNSFLNILRQLFIEFHKKNHNWLGLSESLLVVLRNYILSWKKDKERDLYVEKFKHILVGKIADKDVEIKDLLESIPLSNDYFRKKFKKQTGKTPYEYLINLRIDYAKSLLEYEVFKTVKEVAQQVGYSDQYYFSRLFKKKTGVCPSKYKKNNCFN